MTESSARLRRPLLRRPEKHQLGYNTIYLPRAEPLSADVINEAATLLKLKQADLERILSQGVSMPLARTARREEAELILDRLQALGFRVVTLIDEGAVKRVKSMEFGESELVINAGHPKDEVAVSWSNVVLLAPARLVEKRVEVKEVTSRRAENEILDTSEFFSDETVIDIYLSTHAETWRVSARAFDYSCLGSEKALTAGENMTRLQRRLITHATNARFDDSYKRLQPMLDLVWGPERETKSGGWRRERPGKLSLGMATIESNESQVTRYSRLLYYVMSHQLAG